MFFAHFMGSMLHSPVAVIYGERLVATAIAAEGDRVAVAYEEPNGTRQQVDVALSQTQGHIFEWHATASRDVEPRQDRPSRLRVRVWPSRAGRTPASMRRVRSRASTPTAAPRRRAPRRR